MVSHIDAHHLQEVQCLLLMAQKTGVNKENSLLAKKKKKKNHLDEFSQVCVAKNSASYHRG